jgi:hypothetical protein
LYYKKVHAVVDHQILTSLARICGPETLLGLIEDGYLGLNYLENRPAVSTRTIEHIPEHGFVLVQARGKESQNLVPNLFHELTGKPGRGRRLANRFLSRIETRTYAAGDFEQSIEALRDGTYTDRLALRLLSALGVAGAPKTARFRIARGKEGFAIDTDLDFAILNAEYQRHHPESSISPALILDILYEGYAELDFAAALGTEITPTPTESAIAEERLAAVLQASGRSIETRSIFQDLAIQCEGSVSEAINAGRRNFEDLRRLLEKARQFKQWLHGQAPDADLAKAYVEEVTRISWKSEPATKNLRFILFNAAQIAAGRSRRCRWGDRRIGDSSD